MVSIILFLFGIAFGSFFNVVAMRYEGERFVFSGTRLGGRSHCPHCHSTLRWYELVPVVSFMIQGARCRHCGKGISFVYPVVELLTGFIFALVPLRLEAWYGLPGSAIALPAALWIIAFCILLLSSFIDIRLGILPDELTALLAIDAVLIAIVSTYVIPPSGTFLPPFIALFGLPGSIVAGRVIGALFGLALFWGLHVVTRGRGMGMGDVKLAPVLGFLFGWPDIFFLCVFAFVIGAIVGIIAIFMKRKTMQGTLPFAPFLALGSVTVFFAGSWLLNLYLRMLGIG